MTDLVVTVTVGIAVCVPVPGASAAAPTGPDYTVPAGQTVPLCGTHRFGALTIELGGVHDGAVRGL